MGEQLVHWLGVALEELPLRQVEPLYHPVEIIRRDHPQITSVLDAHFPLILCGHSTLFIRLPRREILRSPDARSCIDRPQAPREWLLWAATRCGRGIHLVVAHKDAGILISSDHSRS